MKELFTNWNCPKDYQVTLGGRNFPFVVGVGAENWLRMLQKGLRMELGLCQEILWFLDSCQQKGCLWVAPWNVRASSKFLKLKLWVTLHRKLTENKWGWDQMSCFKVWNPPKVLSRLKKWVLFSALPAINYVIMCSLLSLGLSFLT